MADLTEVVGNQMLKISGNFIKSSGEFLEELLKLLEKNKIDDPNKYTIMKHIDNGGEVYTSTVKNEFIADMEQHLQEQGVAYIFMDLGDNDDSKMLIIRDIDKTRAEFATKMVLAEKQQLCEFERDEFLNMTPKSELACVSGLSLHEYELFRDMAKNNGLKFAATIAEDNTVHILYNVNETAQLNQSMKQMTWNLTGRNGDEFEAVYKTRAEAQMTIKQFYNKKIKSPVYLVDARHPNQVIRIDKDGIAFCPAYDKDLTREANFNDDRVVFIPASEKKFIARASEMIENLGEPVVVKLEDMKHMDKVLARKLPKIDKEWQEKEEPFREKYDALLKAENDFVLDEEHAYEPGFSFTTITEREITFDKEEWRPDDVEKKEIDQHVHDAIVRVKTYHFHNPQEKQLMKLIDAAKRKKTYEQAKSEVEREEKAQAKRNARAKKAKDDYRDK